MGFSFRLANVPAPPILRLVAQPIHAALLLRRACHAPIRSPAIDLSVIGSNRNVIWDELVMTAVAL